MKRVLAVVATALIVIGMMCGPVLANDLCDLANTVAGKAAEAFQKDKAEGLKLFIKAQQLCPDSALLNYDLGVAYYQYGRLADAQKYIEAAIAKDDTRAVWHNNLAAVLLERRTNPDAALVQAKKAFRLDENSAAIRGTLALAQLASGDLYTALTTIDRAQRKWPGDKALARRRAVILDTYLSHYLEAIRGGQVDAGLAGLKQADAFPKIYETRCVVLAKLGRMDEALAAAAAGPAKFPGDAGIAGVFDKVAGMAVRGFYRTFQQGSPAKAVSEAKKTNDEYPNHPVIAKAYNDLLNAFLADASQIEVPAAVAHTETETLTGTENSDRLLAGIGSPSAASTDTNLDLTVDVDANIPTGARKHPYGVAVIIGNQDYTRQGKGLHDVRYAGRDASVMKAYLEKEMGFDARNIIYQLDATSGDMRNIFGTRENPNGMLENYVRPGQSDVFIYYAGHGAPAPNGDNAYLVPVDAQADYIANNGYPLDVFYEMLDHLRAKSVTVVLDACFSGDSMSGPLFKKISPAILKTISPVQDVPHGVVFSSAGKDEVSTWYPEKRHSLFTYFFLKGLGGDADADHNHAITAAEMESYLKKEVPYWARREANRVQHPVALGNPSTVLAQLAE